MTKEQYYNLFEHALLKSDVQLCAEFLKIASKENGRIVFLWLEDLKKNSLLPKELEQPLTEFYWEIL